MRRTPPIALVALLLLACNGAKPPNAQPAPVLPSGSASSAAPTPPRRELGPGLHFDIAAIDPRADPCVSFYDYACGGWRATHPIPADQSKWDRYAEMTAVNVERTRAIVLEAAKAGPSATPAEQRIGAYYSACMDQGSIDARGLSPLRPTLDAIAGVRSRADATSLLGQLHAQGLDAALSIYPSTDIHDAKRNIAWLDKGTLGMPEPSDYTAKDDATVARRGAYVAHLERLFALLGDSKADAAAAAKRTLAFETALAEHALSRGERRQREKLDHPMSLAELEKRWPSIAWKKFFAAVGLPTLERVNVAQPAWFDALEKELSKRDLGGLRDQLRMVFARGEARLLPSSIEAEVFDFRERTLRGKKAMSSREKRCLGLIDEDVGDDVGRIFVARHFSPEARARTEKMIAAVVAAYRADMDTASWLGPEARAEARAKLDTMLVVLGRSNRPRDLDGLVVKADDALGNALRAQAAYVKDELGRIDKPVDRELFFESLPQELDGFGSKSLVATGFTAGFLQPPLLDPEMDDAVIFGGLGSVIGHELSHQFDDEGRKYDKEGNLRSWWSPEDVTRYEERAKCFVDEYSSFKLEDGTPIDGRLTLGENIADNGGIRLSFAALQPSYAEPRIDGFSPAQRFFLAWAQIRCENVTPEQAKRLATSNEHAPGRFRVDGVVSNMPELARAFSCKAGTPMAPEKRCAVW